MRMRRISSRSLTASALAAGVSVLAGSSASAQDFPVKPIRMLTSAVGSGSDVVGRIVADMLPARLGQRGIIDNRGILAPELAAKAAPDGYTIVLYSTPLWVSPFLRNNVPWDPIKDFDPITLAVDAPNVIVVHPSVPVKSTKELIALARAKPGQLNFGTGSSGSTSHLAAELFSAMASVSLTRIPYKGVGPATIGLLGGEVDIVFAAGSAVGSHIKSGRLRALAVTSLKPSALFPGMPTVTTSGVPGYEAGTPLGIFAPAGTPAAIINRLQQAIVSVINSEEVRKRVLDTGADIIGSTPEEFAAYLKTDIAKWGKLIKQKSIRE